jgi:hypothetical protein
MIIIEYLNNKKKNIKQTKSEKNNYTLCKRDNLDKVFVEHIFRQKLFDGKL